VAGTAHMAGEAAAENIRNKARRTDMLPHDTSSSHRRLQALTGTLTLSELV
jgi:hypothetical protein